MKTELLIVGASCVGGMTAKTAAARGIETTIIEEHNKPGKFDHCTAICSKKGLDTLGVSYQRTVKHHIRGAVVHSHKKQFIVDTKKTVAEVFDRQAFDERCVQEAIDAGAKLATGEKLSALTQDDFKVNASTTKNHFESRFAIGTDGATSSVAQLAGFPRVPLQDHAYTWQATFDNVKLEHPELVDVILDARDYPQFFAWLVPCGDNSARIGLGTTKHAQLQKGIYALLKHPSVATSITHARKVFEFYHPIPLKTRKQTQKGRVLLAGDAAGQVKSTTGGGIVFGGLCGQTASESVHDAMQGKPLEYETLWRTRYGNALKAHRALHLSYRTALNPLLDIGGALIGTLGLNKLLERWGDMDNLVSLQ
ncbi:MAG TPA: NAD(P)/FAD-dependent oxidoreductase [Candidatus Norongarragalinales archaeon]|jgi:geranylgeranyl reductase family protein|nr:NAD(P)/FAD-dependent oxidoreductase [Candidatus Norongarragalinales archaeon]